MMNKQASIIILAAGTSSRTTGNKMLYKLKGNSLTIIETVVKTALNSESGPVIVVTGHEGDLIENALTEFADRIILIHNENYRIGMSESVKTGIKKAKEEFSDIPVMIIPGDCPLVTETDIKSVLQVYHQKGMMITVASYQGRRGHPILFDSSLFDELLAIEEKSHGLKSITSKFHNELVETGNPGVLKDFDTDDDFISIDKSPR
ncbi:MAG: nucleotidyltransferase family protein [Candidatus Hodarchaeales archaeon]